VPSTMWTRVKGFYKGLGREVSRKIVDSYVAKTGDRVASELHGRRRDVDRCQLTARTTRTARSFGRDHTSVASRSARRRMWLLFDFRPAHLTPELHSGRDADAHRPGAWRRNRDHRR